MTEELVKHYQQLFTEHGIPQDQPKGELSRILMISTHGYWGNPPPAGVPDTGGQTYYVLEISKHLSSQQKQVLILCRHFDNFPLVEKFGDNLWLIRLRVGVAGFVRKEDIYALCPELSLHCTAIGKLFHAEGVVGHYADGMVNAVEVGEQLKIPVINVPHSLGVIKMKNLGKDPFNQEHLRESEFNFWIREQYEICALRGGNFEVANTPEEPEMLQKYYGVEVPNMVMPAGATQIFFDSFGNPEVEKNKEEILGKFGLVESKFIMYWGRMAEAKNVQGVVRALGEAKKVNPEFFKDFKALIIGGSPDNPSEEEKVVAVELEKAMQEYNLPKEALVRVESQKQTVIAPIASFAFAFVGMQKLEPFGMSTAEAMGLGIPVLISKAAGITRWLNDGKEIFIIDPQDARVAGEKLGLLAKDPELVKSISTLGREKALNDFSWAGIANRFYTMLLRVRQGLDPRDTQSHSPLSEKFLEREGRAYHRSTFAWRGDLPSIKPPHVNAAEQLFPKLIAKLKQMELKKERLTVAISGESGSGKSEICTLLTLMLPKEGFRGAIVPGDAFFIRPPQKNHENRVKCYKEGKLSDGVGTHEVDLKLLDSIMMRAKDRETKVIKAPSDCRSLPGTRYPDVPIVVEGVDVVFVDLTYAMFLENISLKFFLQKSSLDNIEHVRQRNLERDPNQDFNFIEQVLKLEHQIIEPSMKMAHFVIDKEYKLVE